MVVESAQGAILREGDAAVEIARFETACGPRLKVRDLSEGGEIYLDPIELEGLTRAPGTDFSASGGGIEVADPDEDVEQAGPGGEIFQNEFAMVQVSRTERGSRARLLIRDLASRAEVFVAPSVLQRLTQLKHREFSLLLDPSELVAATEPDPDQV